MSSLIIKNFPTTFSTLATEVTLPEEIINDLKDIEISLCREPNIFCLSKKEKKIMEKLNIGYFIINSETIFCSLIQKNKKESAEI